MKTKIELRNDAGYETGFELIVDDGELAFVFAGEPVEHAFLTVSPKLGEVSVQHHDTKNNGRDLVATTVAKMRSDGETEKWEIGS